jgi:3-oxoadipate enol-lactonase
VAAVDWLDRLHEIDCPTLVLAGALDIGAPAALAAAIAERIPGATLAVSEQASHLSVAEQPAWFAEQVRTLMRQVAA